MTKPKTCRNCKFWGERGKGSNEPFAARCKCMESPKWNWIISEDHTCDKHQSKDRQRKLKL